VAVNFIGLICFLPIWESLLQPAINKCRATPLTSLQKMVTGVFFWCLAMFTAGINESYRRQAPLLDIASICFAKGEGYKLSTMTLWWQLPQLLLGTLGYALCFTSAYSFFSAEAPPAFLSLSLAFYLFSYALGAILDGVFTHAHAPHI